MIDCTVLSVKEEHLCECSDVIRKAFAINAKKYGFTKENYPSSGAFITSAKLLENKKNGAHMFAILHNDKIIAFVQLTKINEKEYAFQKFSVLPEFRQIGLGAILINVCKDKAKELNATKISLIMVDKNEYLKDYYTQNGFIVTGTKKDNDHPFLQCMMELYI